MKKKEVRLENIEIALLDLALAIESGEWQGVYQKTAETILIPPPKKKPTK